jgi:hypothetical protein
LPYDSTSTCHCYDIVSDGKCYPCYDYAGPDDVEEAYYTEDFDRLVIKFNKRIDITHAHCDELFSSDVMLG